MKKQAQVKIEGRVIQNGSELKNFIINKDGACLIDGSYTVDLITGAISLCDDDLQLLSEDFGIDVDIFIEVLHVGGGFIDIDVKVPKKFDIVTLSSFSLSHLGNQIEGLLNKGYDLHGYTMSNNTQTRSERAGEVLLHIIEYSQVMIKVGK